MSRRPKSPLFVGALPPTHDNSPPPPDDVFGDAATPIPPPAQELPGKPPRHPGPPKLTPQQIKEIKEKGVAGKGRKTKKRKSKSRRRRNGRTYRRS